MVNILFCGNRGVFDGMLTCALSILKRSSTHEPFTFYLYTMSLPRCGEAYVPIEAEQVCFFEETVKRYHKDNRAVLVDVTELYEQELGHCPNESAYCSPYTLIRLLADLVEGMPDRLLYLDVDVLLNRDVHLLYDMDIEGYEYAAAPDHYGKYLIHPHYINAGVLLFNLPVMRQTGILRRARELLRERKLVFADQSALIRATTRRKLLAQRFNDQKYLHKHTVIRHFSKRLFWLPYPHTANIKPWHTEKVRKIFRYRAFEDVLTEYETCKETYNREVLSHE
ncbi:MAG: lipopolysaccharide biosynthesis protein [Ruminococcaceae bacterium]|nr:lipopolysaccharide biosynthesis protein [Oscillospiraceae bacterium]